VTWWMPKGTSSPVIIGIAVRTFDKKAENEVSGLSFVDW